MIWRHELKFILQEEVFHHLYFSLRPVLHHDHNSKGDDPAGFRGYRIRSLYFDDAGKSGIFDKLTGADPRHKFRIRIYNDNDQVIHLEKKIKSGNMTQKQSCRLSRQQVDYLLEGECESLYDDALSMIERADGRGQLRQARLLLQFYSEIRTRLLKPAILVDYERIPLTWPDGNVRITFDRYMSTGLFRQDLWDPDAAMMPAMAEDQLIMEVKYDRFLPDFIRSAIQLPGASLIAVSKYVQCAGACRQMQWEDHN